MKSNSILCSVVFTLILTSFSCAPKAQQRRDAKHFPTQPEIVKLMNQKQADILKDKTPGKIVDIWKLKAPLPTMIGETIAVPTNKAEGALAEAIKDLPKIQMTDSMNCIANQHTAFRAVHKKAPFDSLERFISARCGSIISNNSMYFRVISEALTRDIILAQAKKITTKFQVSKRRRNIGVSFIEGKNESLLLFVVQRPSIQIDPIPMQAGKGGVLKFKGTYIGKDIVRYSAKFNVGEFGAEYCERQPVEPPAFSFICKTNPKDSFTYIEVDSNKKGAQFNIVNSTFMAFPNTPIDTYIPPTSRRILHAAENKKSEGTNAYLQELINRVRNSGGSRAIPLNVAQTEIIQSLTPAYFAPEDEIEEKNKVLLAMLAGWEIKDEIISTSFRSGYIDGTNAISMLESVLESPGGRKTLLAKNVSSFGIGVVSKPKRGTRYIFVSYDYLQNEHMNKRISRVMESLRKERKLRGLSPPKELTQYRTKAAEWAQEFREGATFEAIQKKMYSTFRYDYGSDKTLWYNGYTISGLDGVNFHKDILNAKNLKIMIFVTPYRPKNSPRTFFALFYVFEK